jgi:hypothetical protein
VVAVCTTWGPARDWGGGGGCNGPSLVVKEPDRYDGACKFRKRAENAKETRRERARNAHN